MKARGLPAPLSAGGAFRGREDTFVRLPASAIGTPAFARSGPLAPEQAPVKDPSTALEGRYHK